MTVKDNEKAIELLAENQKEIRKFLFGNGDRRGADEVLRDVERKLDTHIKEHQDRQNYEKQTYSNLKHLISIYMQREGLDAMGNPIDKKLSNYDKTVIYFRDNVLPYLIVSGITWLVVRLAGG